MIGISVKKKNATKAAKNRQTATGTLETRRNTSIKTMIHSIAVFYVPIIIYLAEL